MHSFISWGKEKNDNNKMFSQQLCNLENADLKKKKLPLPVNERLNCKQYKMIADDFLF